MAQRPPRLFVKTVTTLALLLYRATGGRIGGRFGRVQVLLLTTTGRRSGKKRTAPLGYLEEGGRPVVIASFGGSNVHPAWYLNLVANPDVEVQLRGAPRRPMRARTASPEERERLWPRAVEMYAGYAKYQEKTAREIPLVILESPGEAGRL